MPGSLDASGVYQYAEDDALAAPTWSAYMNKLAASVSAVIAGLIGADVGWTALTGSGGIGGTFGSGITGYTTAPWVGVQCSRRLRYATVAGAVTKGTALASGETVLTLPAGWRPVMPVQANCSGGSMELRSDGRLVVGIAPGTGTVSFTVTFPVG